MKKSILLMLAFFLFSWINASSDANGESIILLIKHLESKITSLELKVNDLSKGQKDFRYRIDKNEKKLKEIGKTEEELSERADHLKREVDLNTKVSGIVVRRFGLHEWMFDTRELNWSSAEAECVKWGGHLLTIQSQNENDYFYNEIKKRNFKYFVWIGLNDIKEENKWEWISGIHNVYTNWFSGQPSGGRRENCAASVIPSKGEWHDAPCDFVGPFICERPLV